jgi:hypothetical protein
MQRVIDTYFGGKAASGTYQKIINHIRPHDCYIEPFLGGGTIMLTKKPAATNIAIELDPVVYRKWQKDARHLPHIQLIHGSAFDFLEKFDYSQFERVCVYLDPPYPLSSRKDPNSRYACELTDDEHIQLLNLIKKLPANVDVLISTYPNLMYAEALIDWHCIRFQSQTRRGKAWELLFINYLQIDDLHDTSFAGHNYRDRERIKKKVNRWVNKYNQMDMAERRAIFQALAQLPENNASPEDMVLQLATMASTADDDDSAGSLAGKVSDISPRQMILFS